MTTVERLFIGGPAHGKRDLIESIHATEPAQVSMTYPPHDIKPYGRAPRTVPFLNTRTYYYHCTMLTQTRAVFILEGLEGAEALVDVLFDAIKINS